MQYFLLQNEYRCIKCSSYVKFLFIDDEKFLSSIKNPQKKMNRISSGDSHVKIIKS